MTLVARTSRFLERRVSRRGFLGAAATVGAALVVNPVRYVLEPISARAALASCTYGPPGNPNDCANCCDLCCAGWTEFCCATHPETGNACPPGTIPAGWWRADGSGLCDVDGVSKPRYYVDCNAECLDPVTACGDEASPATGNICGPSCTPDFAVCECAHGDCSYRKTSCAAFRYGQCNQDVKYVGVVVCRKITCTPPWIWDPSCTSHDPGESTSTRFHDRPCLHDREPYHSFPAMFGAGSFALRRGHDTGPATTAFAFGAAADWPVFGDWDGSRRRTVGVVRNAVAGRIGDDGLSWHLRLDNTAGDPDLILHLGQPGDIPVVGDWDGDGVDGIGIYRDGLWILRNELSDTPAEPDLEVSFGLPGDHPVVGDWNGDGRSTLGVVRNGLWILRQPYGPRDDPAQELETFAFGPADAIPVVGDWDGDGSDGPGFVVGNQWTVRWDWWRDTTRVFTFGTAGDRPAVWAHEVSRT